MKELKHNLQPHDPKFVHIKKEGEADDMFIRYTVKGRYYSSGGDIGPAQFSLANHLGHVTRMVDATPLVCSATRFVRAFSDSEVIKYEY